VVLTPGQQKALFVLVVVVLAALGYFLVLPSLRHSQDHNQAAPSPTPTTPSPQAPPPSTESAAPVTAGTPNVDIYSWLPFTQQGLADAAAVATRFTVAYDTYSYTENATAYVGTMNGLITTELASTLQAAYATPGTTQLRNSEKQVSTGTAQINSLRAFGPSSIVFVVNARQHLVTSHGTSNGTPQYFVTVTGSATSWQVSDIEFSNAGNS
jgi:hypothetical protein